MSNVRTKGDRPSRGQMILAVSVQMHGDKALEKKVVVDTTVQESNITYPTDTQLHRKIVVGCWKIADEEKISLQRRYRNEWKKIHKGARRLKTIAGVLVRELNRKLSEKKKEAYEEKLSLYRQVLAQKPQDKNKI